MFQFSVDYINVEMCYFKILNLHFWFWLCSDIFFWKALEVTGSLLPTDLLKVDSTLDDAEFLDLNDRITYRVHELGYDLKMYEVHTDDDYFLKLYRLSKGESTKGEPVFIMHGIKGCSAIYLAFKKSIAYYLVDHGYDVWVGNARGTAFSLKHGSKMPNDKEFWNFSFHEMGNQDVPAFLAKIKEETKRPRVHYVGHSMGTTVFLVMGATRVSVVRDSVASVSLIGPIACPCHYKKLNNAFKRFVRSTYLKLVRLFGRGDIYTYRKKYALLMYKVCTSRGILGILCEKYLRRKSGADLFDHVNSLDVLPFYPCGTSVNTYLHYIQMASDGHFQKYDYGLYLNDITYFKPYPPKYNLCCIRRKVHMLIGGLDAKTNKQDVQWLQDHLPDSELVTKEFEEFDHRSLEYGTKMEVLHEAVRKIIANHKEKASPAVPAGRRRQEITTCEDECP